MINVLHATNASKVIIYQIAYWKSCHITAHHMEGYIAIFRQALFQMMPLVQQPTVTSTELRLVKLLTIHVYKQLFNLVWDLASNTPNPHYAHYNQRESDPLYQSLGA